MIDIRTKALSDIQEQLKIGRKLNSGERALMAEKLRILKENWPSTDPNGAYFQSELEIYIRNLDEMSTILGRFETYMGGKLDQWQRYLKLT